MSVPLLRSFDRLDDANAARDALVAAGISPSAVQIRAMEDEGGPSKGSFAVGNGVTEDSSRAKIESVAPGADSLYEANFGDAGRSAGNLLIVMAADEAQRREATAVLDRFRGRDVDVGAAGAAGASQASGGSGASTPGHRSPG